MLRFISWKITNLTEYNNNLLIGNLGKSFTRIKLAKWTLYEQLDNFCQGQLSLLIPKSFREFQLSN